MANHTPDTLLKLLQIMWSKQELIGKAVGAPLGFQMSKEFIVNSLSQKMKDIILEYGWYAWALAEINSKAVVKFSYQT